MKRGKIAAVLVFLVVFTAAGSAAEVILDDWERSNPLTDYTGNTGEFSIVNSPTYAGSNALQKSTDASDAAVYNSSSYGQGNTFKTSARFTVDSTGLDFFHGAGVVFAMQDSENYYLANIINRDSTDQDEMVIYSKSGGGFNIIKKKLIDYQTFEQGEWYQMEVEWTTNNEINLTVKDAYGEYIDSIQVTDSTYTSSGKVGFRSNSQGPTWDARTEPDPSVSLVSPSDGATVSPDVTFEYDVTSTYSVDGARLHVPDLFDYNTTKVPSYSNRSPFLPSNIYEHPGIGDNAIATDSDISGTQDAVADPFLTSYNDTLYMFVEVKDSGSNGDIGYYTSQDGTSWTYQGILIDESFHMAHPTVVKPENSDYFYMFPHTEVNGDFNDAVAYRTHKSNFPTGWTYEGIQLEAQSAGMDTVVFQKDDRWWMLYGENGNTYANFTAQGVDDPLNASWNAHFNNPIVSSTSDKDHPMGRWINTEDGLRGFYMNSSGSWGQSVRAYDVTLNTTTYSDTEITESPILEGDGTGWNSDKMHHISCIWGETNFNYEDRWMCAVDGNNGSTWQSSIYVSDRWDEVVNSTNTVSTSSTNSIDYSFWKSGSYNWYVEVDDVYYGRGTSNTRLLQVETNQAPTASFTSNSPVLTGEDFGLDASGSSDPDGDTLSYYWDLDNDGQYDDATGVTPSHSEPDDGTYTIGLKVSDGTANNSTSNTVTVENRDPSASFTDNSPVLTSEDFGLDASGSSDSDGSISSYEWDFDNDGNYDDATGVSPSHSEPDNGDYTIGLRVTDNDGGISTTSNTVTVQNRAPTADYTYTTNDKTLNVDGTSSSDPDGSISSYEWDWDNDGTYEGTGSTASFTYSSGGDYSVTLRVTDDDGSTDTITQTVHINEDPTATYTADDPKLTGENINFDASGTTDPEGQSLTYEWDVDNDGTYEQTGVTTSESYPDNGTYTVTLKVTDSEGGSDTYSDSVTVENRQPVSDFSYSPSNPAISESISFDGTLSSDQDGTISTYEWDWTSDGTYETTGSNPSHSYGSPGDYDVTLRVTDDDGSTATSTQTVTVTDQTSPSATITYTGDDPTNNLPLSLEGDFTDNNDLSSYTLYRNDSSISTGSITGTSATVTTSDSPADGTYTYKYQATDSGGNSANSSTVTVTVDTTDPFANYDYTPTNPEVGENINFNATDSLDDRTGISSYEWDWTSDGTYEGTGVTPAHTYSSTGTFDATLRVTDGAGNTDTYTDSITVSDTTNPSISNGQPTGEVYDRTPTISADFSDNYELNSYSSTVEDPSGQTVATDSGSLSGTSDSASYTTQNLDDVGTYTVEWTAEDTAGNTNTIIYTFDLQQINPPVINSGTVSDDSNSNGIVTEGDLSTIESNVTKPDVGTVENVYGQIYGNNYTLTDGNDDNIYDLQVTVPSGLSTQSEDLTVESYDNYSNKNTETFNDVITVDNTAPNIGTIYTPDSVNQSQTFTLTSEITEAESTVQNPKVEVFGENHSLTPGNGDNYTAEIEVDYTQTTGDYFATVYAEDEESNEASKVSNTITVEEGDFKFGNKTYTRTQFGTFTYTVVEGVQGIWTELDAADGGYVSGGNQLGGEGSYVEANITAVSENDDIVVEVGEGGELAVESKTFGGGGAGVQATDDTAQGGGGSHLYINPSSGSSDGGYDFSDRIIIAGGGAGADPSSGTTAGGGRGIESTGNALYYGEDGQSQGDYAGGGGGYYGGTGGSPAQGGSSYVDTSTTNYYNVVPGTDGAGTQNEDGSLTMKVLRPDRTAPNVTINSPSDGDTITDGSIEVNYQISEPETDIVNHNVTVNGTTKTGNSTFNYNTEGTYEIKVKAENSAGYVTTETITVEGAFAYTQVDTDPMQEAFVESGPKVIKYDSNLNQVWNTDLNNTVNEVESTENYAFAYLSSVPDLYRLNKENGSAESVLPESLFTMRGFEDQLFTANSDRLDIYNEDGSFNSFADEGVVWSNTGYHSDTLDAEGYTVTAMEVVGKESLYLAGTDSGGNVALWHVTNPDTSTDTWEVQWQTDTGVAGTPQSLQFFVQEQSLLTSLDNGELHEFNSSDGTHFTANPVYSANNIGQVESLLDAIFIETEGEVRRLNYTGQNSPVYQTWSYTDETVSDFDRNVGNLTIITEENQIYREEGYDIQNADISIESISVNRDPLKAGQDVTGTIEVKNNELVTSATWNGNEMSQSSIDTWEYSFTAENSSGNYTKTAKIFTNGEQLDQQDITYEVETLPETELWEPEDEENIADIPANVTHQFEISNKTYDVNYTVYVNDQVIDTGQVGDGTQNYTAVYEYGESADQRNEWYVETEWSDQTPSTSRESELRSYTTGEPDIRAGGAVDAVIEMVSSNLGISYFGAAILLNLLISIAVGVFIMTGTRSVGYASLGFVGTFLTLGLFGFLPNWVAILIGIAVVLSATYYIYRGFAGGGDG